MINGNIHADKDKYKNGKMINTDMSYNHGSPQKELLAIS